MLDLGFGRYREQKEQLDAEQRQLGYSTKQTVIQSASHPSDDASVKAMLDQQSDLFRWQQMLKQDIDQLIFRLGYKQDPDTGAWVDRPNHEAIVNKKCIDKFELHLIPSYFRSSPNTFLKNESINRLMKRKLTDVCIDLAANMNDYGIEEISILDLMADTFENVTYLILRRSAEGWNKRMDTSVTKRIENADVQNKEQQGFYSMLAGSAS